MVRFRLDKKGIGVVCLWFVALGALAAPFAFWQGLSPGAVFSAAWLAVFLLWLPARLARLEGSITLGELRVSGGIWFKSSRRIPTRFVSAAGCFSTPLLRRCGCCVLILSTSGAVVMLPGIADADAHRLTACLQGG